MRRLLSQNITAGLVVITTYEGLRQHCESLHKIEWTAVCCDEGQRLKNPMTIVTKVCKGLPCYHRLILSGTPIQNNLKELWSIFDFVYPGRLGSLTEFMDSFAEPIRTGGYSTATKLQVEIATQTASTLQRIIRPYILRRKKDELQHCIQLPKKTEQILFCKLTKKQCEVYDLILSSKEVQYVLQKRVTAFRAISTLRKLCNHPDLVYRNNGVVLWHNDKKRDTSEKLKKRKSNTITGDTLMRPGRKLLSTHVSKNALDFESEHDLEEEDDNYVENQCQEEYDDDSTDLNDLNGLNWSDSGKLLVLSKILPLWHKEGHKVLLFSQMKSMLDLVEQLLRQFRFKYSRLDGSTAISRRNDIIQTFNADPSIFVMVLTTRTGGLGISLTSANRVILLDPDWNPMTDIQARERSWRIGQKREVTIYRLISRGTIEEKIYQRQIFKILLSKRILENPKQKGLFSKSDLKQLFERSDYSYSNSIKADINENVDGTLPQPSTSTSFMSHDSHIDDDLPADGEVLLRELSTANEDYLHSFKESNGLLKENGKCREKKDGIENEEIVDDGNYDDEDFEMELNTVQPLVDDKNVVLAYRMLSTNFDNTTPVDSEASNSSTDLALNNNILVDDVEIETMEVTVEEKEEIPKHSLTSKIKKGSNLDQNDFFQSKKLLEALFNGDSITGVYDHNYIEEFTSNSSSYIKSTATRFVEDTMKRLYDKNGTNFREQRNSDISQNSYSHISSNRPINENIENFRGINTGYKSSSSLLQAIRSHKQQTSSSSSNPFASSSESTTKVNTITGQPLSEQQQNQSSSFREDLSSRLINLLRKYPLGMNSETILSNFRDLGDHHAATFKNVLKSVAIQSNGLWILK